MSLMRKFLHAVHGITVSTSFSHDLEYIINICVCFKVALIQSEHMETLLMT